MAVRILLHKHLLVDATSELGRLPNGFKEEKISTSGVCTVCNYIRDGIPAFFVVAIRRSACPSLVELFTLSTVQRLSSTTTIGQALSY